MTFWYAVRNIVRPGETISSTSYERRAGGKGANQACAIAKAGGSVELLGAVGFDGAWVKSQLKDSGVGVAFVKEVEKVCLRAVVL